MSYNIEDVMEAVAENKNIQVNVKSNFWVFSIIAGSTFIGGIVRTP